MLKRLVIVLLLAGITLAQQQPPATYNPQLITFPGVPTGPCDIYQVALNTSNGNYYTCVVSTRTWTATGTGTATSGNYPVGTIDTTASKYATPIGATIPDATFTSGQATIDCTFSNDCNFTTTHPECQVVGACTCFGTNFTTDVSILNPTSVVLPEGTLTVTDSQHATCSGGNSTATTTHNGTLVWGKLGHTQLNSAFSDCIAQNGCAYMLPPGLVLVESAVGNSYCGGIAASTPCIEAFGYGRIQVNGYGQTISQLVPTPNFSATSCTGGQASNLNGCFFSAPSIQLSNMGIFGAGQSAIGAGFNGKFGIIMQGNGNYNSYINSLLLLSWGATTAGFTGVKVEGNSDSTLHDVHLDGMGNIGMSISGGFALGGGSTLTTLEGTYAAVTGSTSLVVSCCVVASHGGVYGWTNGSAGGVQVTGGRFSSTGDIMPYQTSNASFSPQLWCTGTPVTCVVDGSFIWNPTTNGVALSMGGAGVAYIINTVFNGSSAGIITVSGTKVFSLGGNLVTGTTKSVNTTSFSGGVYMPALTDTYTGANDSAPTITTHFNTSADTIAGQTPFSIVVTVGTGTGTSTGAIGLPVAPTGWNCHLDNTNRADLIQQTGSTTTSATFTNFGTTFAATNWTNSDVLRGSCSWN